MAAKPKNLFEALDQLEMWSGAFSQDVRDAAPGMYELLEGKEPTGTMSRVQCLDINLQAIEKRFDEAKKSLELAREYVSQLYDSERR